MKKFLYVLVLSVFTLSLGGCMGPVAKVLKDPVKFGIVRDTVFARGLCLNDTVVTSTVRDSVRYRDTTITKTILVRTPAICRIDTLVHGTRVVLADGVLTVTNKTPCKDILRTVKVTNTVRDQSKEKVLTTLIGQARQEVVATKQLLSEEKLALAQRTTQSIVLLALLVLAGLWTARKPLLALIA